MADLPTNELILTKLGVSTLEEAEVILCQRIEGKPFKKERLVKSLLAYGSVSDGFKPVLRRALNCSREELEAALRKKREIEQWEGWVRRFQELGPHFHIETRGRPAPLFAAAMTWRQFKVKPVPDVAELPTSEDRLAYAINWAKEHAAEIPAKLPVFGEVTGMTFYGDVHQAFRFDTEGNYLGVATGSPWNPAVIRVA